MDKDTLTNGNTNLSNGLTNGASTHDSPQKILIIGADDTSGSPYAHQAGREATFSQWPDGRGHGRCRD
ncbi:MAG: hypothetical protein Q9183_007266 [Haloplaca sp. 2 TL-2023]